MTPKRIKKKDSILTARKPGMRVVTKDQISREQNKNGYVPPRNKNGSISIKANVSLLRGKDKQEFINLYSSNKK